MLIIILSAKDSDSDKSLGLSLEAALCLFLFALAFWGIATDPDSTLDAAEGMNMISAPIELFTNISFLVFTSDILSLAHVETRDLL